jgi:cytochrome c peroxidase
VCALPIVGCGTQLDGVFCPNGNCGWSPTDAERIAALADLPEAPPVDSSNKYATDSGAMALGRQFFWDARFSGTGTMTDALQRPVPFARATAAGQPLNVACVTCHDLSGGAADPSTVPGNVSLGATWTDTNASSLWNSAFQKLFLWNGRADSLWAQAAGVIEATMGNNRLRVAWKVSDLYRDAYQAVFIDYPLPMGGTSAGVAGALETSGPRAGQCRLDTTSACPTPACRQVSDPSSGATGCWPQFPLDGKPGAKAGCQPGDPTEPFGDAFDCMDPADQTAVTRVAVNFGKAIAAFEYQLVSRASPFDHFVADLRAGHADESTAISAAAKNGARLFVGKAGCSDCHNTPLFSDGEFYNVGVLQVGQAVPTLSDCPQGGVCDCVTPKNCLPFGAYDGIAKLRKNPYRRDSTWSDNPADLSRKSFLDAPLDSFPKGGFRVPGLRSVALSAPYMHDGAIATLEDVVALYDRGGDPGVGDRAARIKPLMLTADERAELVEFLKSLTGATLPADLITAPQLPPAQ